MKKLCVLLTSTMVLFSMFSMTAFALGNDSASIDIGAISSSDLVGDINLDDNVNNDDFRSLVQDVLENQNDYEILLKDVNGDGFFDARDLVRMKKVIAEMQQ